MSERAQPYPDRYAAGQALAELLGGYRGRPGLCVLALPRGGVPVADPVARALGATLDVLVVRKLGVPRHRELAMGAIAGVGDEVRTVRNEPVLARAGVGEAEFAAARARELAELRRREGLYRAERPRAEVAGRTVIVVDDGVATGATMRAAVAAVRAARPERIVVAVPVGAQDTVRRLAAEADEAVCAWTPEPFYAVGQGYTDFAEVTDEQVRALLAR